jgi:hypothetical protein
MTSSSQRGKGKKGKGQRPSSSGASSPPPLPRLSMVLNDIKPHALAQAVVMFKAVLELAEAMEALAVAADSIQELDLEQDDLVLQLAGRALSLYAAPLLLPDDAAWIKALLERGVASRASEEVRAWACVCMCLGGGDFGVSEREETRQS